MLPFRRAILIVLAVLSILLWAGCGMSSGNGTPSGGLFPLPAPTPTPIGPACNITISGRVYDTTSSADLAGRVLVALETGGISPAYSINDPVTRYFPWSATVPVAGTGTFGFCVTTADAQYGLAIVMSSKTSDGKFFGPTAILIPNSALRTLTDIGDVRIAGDQPSGYEPPDFATVNIPITSDPLQLDGSLWALTTIADPNNPSKIVEIGVPIMTDPLLIQDGAETFHTVWPAFNITTATATPAIKLPSERPWVRNENTRTYSPAAGQSAYRIAIGESNSNLEPNCDLHWKETALMADKTPLIALPGTSVTADTVAFTSCVPAAP